MYAAGLAIALYAALAVVHTHPLLLNRSTHLPGLGLGDNVSFAWNLWWMREAVASPEYDYFFCPLILAPHGASLVLHTHTAAAAFAGATILAPLTIVEAQNILLIASLVLNGFAAYVLAMQVTGSRPASTVAGALFLVAPAVTARLMGHYNLAIVWPLVLACAAWMAWVRRASVWTAVGLGLAASLVVYADYYYAVFFLLFALAYAATELWRAHISVSRREKRTAGRILFALALPFFALAILIAATGPSAVTLGTLRVSMRTPTNALTAAWVLAGAALVARWRLSVAWSRRRSLPLRRLTAPLVLFLLLTSPVAVEAWRLYRSGDYATQSSALRSSPRGVDVATLALGHPFHGVTGSAVRDLYARNAIDAMESSAWLGAAAMALVAVALRGVTQTHEMRQWAAIGAVFGLWSLGPYLQVLGANTGLLLPQAAARLVPVLNNARIPGRAFVVVTLCTTVLIALLLARAAGRRRLIVWTVAALGIVESVAAPLPLSPVPDAPFRQVLWSDPERTAAVLPLPFGIRDGFGERGSLQHEALFAQTVHGHALTGGFLARVSPRVWAWYEATEPYRSLLRLSAGDENVSRPGCNEIAEGLRRGNVSYVSLDRRGASPALIAFVEEGMPLERIGGHEHHALYRVTPGPCSER